jgi:mevalonate kinase
VSFTPGRICLVGEHCDWAGGASIVVPLDRFLRVTASEAPELAAEATMEGRSLAWREGGDPGPLRYVPAVADELAARFGMPRRGHVSISGDLPPGRGFSSSAALCVGVARALGTLHGLALDASTAADVAYAAERERVGVNCGRLDPLACAHGVPLFLRFAAGEAEVEPLAAHLALAVGAFAAPRDTPGMLHELGVHHRGEVPLRDMEAVRRVGAVRGAIEGFAAQSFAARQALVGGDLVALGASMDVCQEIYEEELAEALPILRAPGLGRAVRALRAAGALGAKFSGCGGDGSVIGLYRPGQAGPGVAALDRLGLSAFATEVWANV